jgi:hypothetical protein
MTACARVVICPSGSFVSSPLCKNIFVFTHPKSHLELSASHPTEGRIAIVTDAGRDAVDAAAFCARRDCRVGSYGPVSDQQRADERCCSRTAKSCGPDAPTLASSSRSRVGPTGLRQDISADDGGKRARSPGRARHKLLKPLRAGMPGDSGVLVVTRVRSTTIIAHETAGALGIRHSPRPLWGERYKHDSGAPRRGVVKARLDLTSLRAKRSNPFVLSCRLMDCFAEPVIGRAFARPVGSQ